MISGTIVLEDTAITFSITEENVAVVTVCDPIANARESYTCDGSKFMRALGIALDFNGGADFTSDRLYHELEASTQPSNPALRWIP